MACCRLLHETHLKALIKLNKNKWQNLISKFESSKKGKKEENRGMEEEVQGNTLSPSATQF